MTDRIADAGFEEHREEIERLQEFWNYDRDYVDLVLGALVGEAEPVRQIAVLYEPNWSMRPYWAARRVLGSIADWLERNCHWVR